MCRGRCGGVGRALGGRWRVVRVGPGLACFPENERIIPILLWDGCYWFTEYGR